MSPKRPIRSRSALASIALTAVSLSVVLLGAGGVAAAAPPGASGPTASPQAQICGVLCDGAPTSSATQDRLADGTGIYGRSIELHIDDADAVAWAIIGNGDPTDEVWLDRSFDGGTTWEGKLGDATIPAGSRTTTTALYNINDHATKGVVRACGKAGNVADIVCTGWNATAQAPAATTPAKGAVDALMRLYNNDTGLWNTTGWWNSANALTSVIDYMQATGDTTYLPVLANTYDKNKTAQAGNFTNDYIDDTGWWALAWTRAYDLTGEQRYLDTAKYDVDYMWSYHDNHCGGGVYWNTSKNYKNAVTNELFIKASAEMHARIPGDTDYLARSTGVWQWLRASGMINGQHLVNDGLDNTTCKNNNGITWSYNQGVILGGLTDLYASTGDTAYLTSAETLADASTRSRYLNPGGVLTEPCEAGGCGGDGTTFKGVYVRNLGELAAVATGRPYRAYLIRQASVARTHDRNVFNQYGVHWAGPVESLSAATQQSAVDAQVAPLRAAMNPRQSPRP